VILLPILALSAALLTPSQEAPSATPPVSVERIRAALERAPAWPVDQAAPLFHIDVVERVPDLVPPIDFLGGPVPPGGLYAYEQRQRLGSPTIGQPLITVDLLPFADALAGAIRQVLYQHHTRAARDEVQRAIRAYCAMQSGECAAEIAICSSSR
jgi:hypothetical protein